MRPSGGFIWRELYIFNFQSSGSLEGGVGGGGKQCLATFNCSVNCEGSVLVVSEKS